MALIETLRAEARAAPESGIVAVINHGRLREGLIPLWAGEGDLPTPSFISDAAAKGLADGETFYTWQKGIPALRQALARYYARHFGKTFAEEEFIVTGSGMHAIQLAIDAIAGSGDEVIYLSPAWPNFAAAAGVAGAVPVPVTLDQSGNGWSCDVDKIASAITPRTKLLFINTPSNPTGWTADKETLQAILDLARQKGLWIIADEIYALFHYGHGRAPSFLDVATPEDRILFVNSFSKNWAMTGWRMGWVVASEELGQVYENLQQFNTSGVPTFLQHGAVAAIEQGEPFIQSQVDRCRTARDLVIGRLSESPRVRLTRPDGAFYLFFRVEGEPDSRALALRLLHEANVGLAPGSAFGPGGEGHLRLCFAGSVERLHTAMDRLLPALS